MCKIETNYVLFKIGGKTPLMIAAEKGHAEIVDILLKNDASPVIKEVNNSVSVIMCHLTWKCYRKNLAKVLCCWQHRMDRKRSLKC